MSGGRGSEESGSVGLVGNIGSLVGSLINNTHERIAEIRNEVQGKLSDGNSNELVDIGNGAQATVSDLAQVMGLNGNNNQGEDDENAAQGQNNQNGINITININTAAQTVNTAADTAPSTTAQPDPAVVLAALMGGRPAFMFA